MEQTALDEGHTGLSWLLTGLQEPNYGQIQQTRARSLVKPFSRLSAPSWIPANVGYLRDLDFLEGRIKNVEKDSAKPTREKEYEAAPKPKAKWSNRRKRGKNDTSSGGGRRKRSELRTSGRLPGKCILSSLPDAFIPLLSSSTSARGGSASTVIHGREC